MQNSINQWTRESASTLPSQFFKKNIPSTNTWAREDFQTNTFDFSLYLTDSQSQGKGRDGRSWLQSEPGHCLLSTWSFVSHRPQQPIFSPLVGLALYSSLKSTWPQVSFALKAPNDVYIGDEKLAGILIEMQTGHRQGTQEVFIGLGLNVWGAPKIDIPTTSLTDHTEIQPEAWNLFIMTFFKSLQEALLEGQQPTLSSTGQKQLAEALAQNPNFAVDSVLADGSLVKGEHTIPWRDL